MQCNSFQGIIEITAIFFSMLKFFAKLVRCNFCQHSASSESSGTELQQYHWCRSTDRRSNWSYLAMTDSCVALCLQVWTSGAIQCQICHMTFNDESAISAHYDTAHAQGSGRPEQFHAKHECEVCGRKFTRKPHLRRHLSTFHSVGDVKTFQCDVCPRVFKHKHHLKDHLKRVHKV